MYVYICLVCTDGQPMAVKLVGFNSANRAVAELCNHRCKAADGFNEQLERIQLKVLN